MEDRKLNALPDEALDAVTGGAYYELNKTTHDYDVFTKDGEKVASLPIKIMAEELAKRMTDSGD